MQLIPSILILESTMKLSIDGSHIDANTVRSIALYINAILATIGVVCTLAYASVRTSHNLANITSGFLFIIPCIAGKFTRKSKVI